MDDDAAGQEAEFEIRADFSALSSGGPSEGAAGPKRTGPERTGPRPDEPDPNARGGPGATPRAIAPLTRILRAIGAVALLASASTFLLQRWDQGGDVWRYFSLLAHPALVAGIGVVCGTRLRDTKSARTFLAIAAAFVPALSCILGGLLLSRFGADGVLASLPPYATWVAGSDGAALFALAATAVVAVPVVGFAFMTLARSRAWPLAATYLVGNAVLLVPSRDPTWVTLLAGTYFAGLVALEWRHFSREASLRTLEAGFVRAMLVAPPVLMMIRSALHYDLTAAWYAGLFGGLSVAALALAQVRQLPPGIRAVCRIGSLGHLGIASTFAAETAVSIGLAGTYALPFAATAFAAGAFLASLLAEREAWGEQFRVIAAVGLLTGLAADLLFSPDVLTSAACFAVSIGTLCFGYLNERRPLFVAGLGGVAFALAFHVRHAVMLYAFGRWGTLALLGIAVILVAGYLDRHGAALGPRLRQFRDRVAAW